jgi:hypothetical protein
MISFLLPDELHLFEQYVIDNAISDDRIWIDSKFARIKNNDE